MVNIREGDGHSLQQHAWVGEEEAGLEWGAPPLRAAQFSAPSPASTLTPSAGLPFLLIPPARRWRKEEGRWCLVKAKELRQRHKFMMQSRLD